MHTLHVVNIKCGGCENKITKALEKLNLKNININVEMQTISFEGSNVDQATKKLAKMGYPEAGTPAANKLTKKAKSYISCAVGRLN